MEITVNKENLLFIPTGGGYREVDVQITVDETLPIEEQERVITYEILSMILDPFEYRKDFIDEITDLIIDTKRQLNGDVP